VTQAGQQGPWALPPIAGAVPRGCPGGRKKRGLKKALIEPAGRGANNGPDPDGPEPPKELGGAGIGPGGPAQRPGGTWQTGRRTWQTGRRTRQTDREDLPVGATSEGRWESGGLRPKLNVYSKVELKTVTPVIQFPSTQGLSRAPALCLALPRHAIRSRARDFYALRAHEDVR
jgi:hypothetical protein